MRRFVRNQRGQFVIIAALLVAIMMLSLSPLLHEAATYYTHEPWQEYMSLIGGLEHNSLRLMQLSLVSYGQTGSQTVLNDNLNQLQTDLALVYPGRGIMLAYNATDGPVSVQGTTINYVSGLSRNWNVQSSYTSANANFSLDMSSVGLTGYRFQSTLLLNLTIVSGSTSTKHINVTVGQQDGLPVDGLNKNNFKVNSGTTPLNITSVFQCYDPTKTLVYTIQCNETQSFPLPLDVSVVDQRGIMVVSRYS